MAETDSPVRLLLVEDDPAAKELVKRQMVRLKHELVGVAENGQQAEEMVRDLSPDLILMDIVLPGQQDGVALADHFLAAYDVPSLIVTAYWDPDTIEAVTNSSALGYLLKPPTRQALHVGILSALRLHRRTSQLKQSEQLYRSAFEFAPLGMCHGRLEDGRLLTANQALADFLGYSIEELVGLTFVAITHPDWVDADWENMRRLSAGNLASYSMDKKYLRKDGGEVWGRLRVALASDPSDHPLYFIGLVEDIDQRKGDEGEPAL